VSRTEKLKKEGEVCITGFQILIFFFLKLLFFMVFLNYFYMLILKKNLKKNTLKYDWPLQSKSHNRFCSGRGGERFGFGPFG
jgi:hypothetical protein